MKEGPVQATQSGWQGMHVDALEGKVLSGQVDTHFPKAASWLLAQERQNVGELIQELHEASHSVYIDFC